MNSGTREIAAPTAPSDVIGNEIASGEWKPNSGSIMKLILCPRYGSSFMPSYAAPVYPLFPGPNVSIITNVHTIRTPGIIASPISTPFLPPSSSESSTLWNMFPSRISLYSPSVLRSSTEKCFAYGSIASSP